MSNIDKVAVAVTDMILSGSDITIKQAFGCKVCGNTKNHGNYCNHCGRDKKQARIVVVSTKKTFIIME